MRILTPILSFCLVLSISAMASAQAPGERIRDAFQQVDANGDMLIERSEVPEKALPAFDRLLARGDADKDGKLSAAEFRDLAQKARGAVPPGALADRLKRMDKNGDGKIERSEFTGLSAVFERLDKNKDGSLTRDEIAAPGPRNK
jgi:Ca2+-binding EF-hand superfamily protein